MIIFIVITLKKFLFQNLNIYIYMFKFTVILFAVILRAENILPQKFPFFPKLQYMIIIIFE